MTRILGSWPAYVVLVLGLGVTFAAWRDTNARVQRDAGIQFRHEVARAVQTLDRHLQESVALLIGLGGLYDASDVLERQEFHRYLAGFNLLERYRGVRLVFLARLVEGGQAQRLVVDYVEPRVGNERVFGFDLYSDPQRRASLEYARDRGRITASGPIQLVADPVKRRAVVLQLPLYGRGAAVGTLEERRAAFAGVATVAVQVDQLIEHYLSGQLGRDFELTVHDAGYVDAGAPASGPDWLYRGGRSAEAQSALEGAPGRLRQVSSLQVAGRTWRLAFSTPATRPYGIGGELPQVVLLGGLVTSALLFWVVLAQLRARQRAQLLAASARTVRAAEGLREQLDFIQQLIEAVPQPIFFKDADGRYLGMNRAWERFFGIPREQFVGKSVFELYPDDPGLAQRHHAKDAELFASPGSQSYEAAIRDAQGKLRNTIYNKATFNHSDGTVAGLIGTITDVTGLKDAEAALRASEARFRDLTELSSDWYWEQDADLRFTQISSRIRELSLEDSGQLGSTRWEMPVEGVSDAQWQLHRAQLEARQPFQDFVYQRRDVHGGLRTISISGRPIFDEQGRFQGYRGTGRDITEQRLSEEKIRHMAQHDALTQLPNRVLLHDRIEQAVAQARRGRERLALLFIDLDRFKTINDSLGHAAGDRLLQDVAARLRECTRATDTVARIGGDEFVVLLGNLKEVEAARHVAQKILDALGASFALEGHALQVTPSIGISVFPDDGADADTLLRNADAAMYHAKQAGRNNCQYFRQEMNEAARSRLQLENDLRQAIERAEFTVHYQPLVDLRGGVIVGFEALVRWRHPRRGMVPPQEFIAAAEETGLIRPLGEYVLREACAQARAWRRAGHGGLRAAVNCSARQFLDDGILESVDRALRESGLPASSLDLEITESVLLDGTESVNARFRALRERGVRIAIDDFGTGYSSLSYLKRLSIQQLKIDRSFVRDIGTDPDDAAIVSAIIAIAHTLDLEVVAEGIETPEQLAYLRRAGCDYGQGYLFSAPLPAEEFERLLAGWDPASLPA